MKRPERLVFFKAKTENDDVVMEALFQDGGEPILFCARLPFEDREFYCNVLATNEEAAERFFPEELLSACYCAGALVPEFVEENEQTRALANRCEIARENNNLS